MVKPFLSLVMQWLVLLSRESSVIDFLFLRKAQKAWYRVTFVVLENKPYYFNVFGNTLITYLIKTKLVKQIIKIKYKRTHIAKVEK